MRYTCLRNSWRLLPCLGVLVLGIGGCGGGGGSGDAEITQFPQWDFEKYGRIAVLPGRTSIPEAAADAELLSERLTTLLSQQKTFDVLSRAELKEVFAEQDLSRLADAVNEDTALPEGGVEAAQALVATKITAYNLISDESEQRVPVYARDSRGRVVVDAAGRPIISGEEVVVTYRRGAEVDAMLRVVDAATGKILLSHSARARPRPKTGRNRPPNVTPEQMASAAVRELAQEFAHAVAPVRVEVELDKDSLIVATDYYDGKYKEAKKLPRDLPEFLLVVRELPEETERNQFRLTLTPKDERTELLREEFVWESSYGAEGLSYRIPTELLLETGAERFVAKLYSVGNPQPILWREFSLEEAKEEKQPKEED